jgi:signal transduction histidine kinase
VTQSGSAKWQRLVPKSLRSRMIALLLAVVVVAQGLSSLIWVTQLKSDHVENVTGMASQIAFSISSTVRFFKSLPLEFRHIVLDQLRRMGGSRFFVTFNSDHINISPLPGTELTRAVIAEVNRVIRNELGSGIVLHTDFSLANSLRVFNNDIKLLDLPPGWGHHSILMEPDKTPILVVQVGLAEDEWLYLATLMPTSNGLLEDDYLPSDRVLFMGFTIILVILGALLGVRWLTRPIKLLSQAAEDLGKNIDRPPLPETGSTEVKAAARTFNAMQQRLKSYIRDRETLFSAISHDLKTPITRLRLRAEMLDDEAQSKKFVEDLVELESMVHGALQCVKDTTIQENSVAFDMAGLLAEVCEGANLQQHCVKLSCEPVAPFSGKPAALKRAFTNIIDNAIFYGRRAEVKLCQSGANLLVQVRDFGPGVAADDQEKIFEPYVRLEKSRNRHTGGSGLGLSIVSNIVHAHGGTLNVANHPEEGFVVEIVLPLIAQ